MRESEFSKKVIKRLAWLDRTFIVRTQAGSIVGIPDLLICCNGRFFAWELKVGSNKATKIQEHTLHQIRRAGGDATVVTPENLENEILIIKQTTGVKDDYPS
jgi:hypothetical protein